jgi:hypothetical protein
MLRYLNYHLGGTGITRPTPKQALAVGQVLHVGIETLFRSGNDINAALIVAGVEFANLISNESLLLHYQAEQWTLVSGLLRGFSRVRMPQLLDEYDVLELETEHEVELVPGVILMLRFDAVLVRKCDGVIVLLDYKTLSYLSDDWSKQHEISLQTLLYTWAAAKLFNADQSSVAIQYEGLLKGLYKKDTAKSSKWCGEKVQMSPLCYAYYMPSSGLWSPDYTSAKGWEKVAVWQHYPGEKQEEWINLLEETGRLNDMFPVIPPVMPTLAEREAAVNSVVMNELHFATKLSELHHHIKTSIEHGSTPIDARVYWERRAFEQNRGRCYKFGLDNACPMVEYCFNTSVADLPIEVGGYVPREPHHVGEVVNPPQGVGDTK